MITLSLSSYISAPSIISFPSKLYVSMLRKSFLWKLRARDCVGISLSYDILNCNILFLQWFKHRTSFFSSHSFTIVKPVIKGNPLIPFKTIKKPLICYPCELWNERACRSSKVLGGAFTFQNFLLLSPYRFIGKWS